MKWVAMYCCLSILFLNGASVAFAESKKEIVDRVLAEVEMCDKLSELKIPKQDLPTELDRKKLIQCDARNLYYGIHGPQDFVKARKCALIAFLDADNLNDMNGGVLGVNDILTMIYANGNGVKRNLDIASKFVCNQRNTSFDSSIVTVNFLQGLKSQPIINFDVCLYSSPRGEHFSFSHYLTQCSELARDIKESKSNALLAKLTTDYTSEQKKELNRLFQLARQFIQLHMDIETDVVPHGRSSLEEVSRANEGEDAPIDFKEKLINAINLLEQGQFPDGLLQDYIKNEEQLQNLNKKIKKSWIASLKFEKLHGKDALDNESIKKWRKPQRAWVKYKNQFIKFASLRFSDIPSYQWEIGLQQDRIEQLNDYVGQLGERQSIIQWHYDLIKE